MPAKNVLVPFDGSSNATRALAHAITMAKGRGATVHVLRVEPPLDDYGMVGAYVTPAKHRKATAERALTLLAPAVRRLRAARAPFETHVVWGDPAAAAVRAAARLKCGSIVMGTRGMGSAANLLLGSVSTKVVHLAKVPVTLVK